MCDRGVMACGCWSHHIPENRNWRCSDRSFEKAVFQLRSRALKKFVERCFRCHATESYANPQRSILTRLPRIGKQRMVM